MNLQIDITKPERLNGLYQLNLAVNGICIQTVMFYESDFESMIEEDIVHYCKKDRTPDSAGVLATSDVFKRSKK